ncbi:hypothetical protein B0O80DRAFT_439724 [Mortierella sp. GBAus27b]|nr:hypothetical protein BGX31_002008 [Mortierella sp. GBA43]KAI8360624.1 hypothetical protein B0O80DRAFT_439724 [Mortierella sp. GBAus27b]
MESGGSTIAFSAADPGPSQGSNSASVTEYQSFRSHGNIVKIKVKHNRSLGAKYVYWSDLSSCFPGIARVQLGDVILTFMRGDDELRMKPFRIEHIPGEILDVVYHLPQFQDPLAVHAEESSHNPFLHNPDSITKTTDLNSSHGQNAGLHRGEDHPLTTSTFKPYTQTNNSCEMVPPVAIASSKRNSQRKGAKSVSPSSSEETHVLDQESTSIPESSTAASKEVFVKQVAEALVATDPPKSLPTLQQQQKQHLEQQKVHVEQLPRRQPVQEQQTSQQQRQQQQQQQFQEQQLQPHYQKLQQLKAAEDLQQLQQHEEEQRQQQKPKQKKQQQHGQNHICQNNQSIPITQPIKQASTTPVETSNSVNGHGIEADAVAKNGPAASHRGSKPKDRNDDTITIPAIPAGDPTKSNKSTGKAESRITGPSNNKKSNPFGHVVVVTGDCDKIHSKLTGNALGRTRGPVKVQEITTLEQIMALAQLHGEFDPKPWIGFDESSRTEILRLKRDVMNCVQLLNSYMKSSAGDEILQAERFGLALERVLKDMNSRAIQDHVLREQIELLQQGAAMTKDVVSKLRPLLLQVKANHITGVHYGVFEHLDQKMFVILPEGDSFKDGFKLHFLCECCQLTRIDYEDALDQQHQNNGVSKKDRITTPHHLHFTRHEGYKLRYTEEFVARFGNHMWILLHMLQDGYEDQGVAVPPIGEDSPLRKKIALAIAYIESEPDPGEREGSWDFSRVSEFYVPVGVTNEGSVGSLCRIITRDGYAKWVCYEHYRERFPENDYKILQNTLNTFFYNEALGAVLVSLSSREEAEEFYQAIVKAVNLQELGMELAWEVIEQDIAALQVVLSHATAVSIKIYVPSEHHVVAKAAAVATKDQTRGPDVSNPSYVLGHYKTNLIKDIVNNRRVQAFYLETVDRPDYPDYQDSLHLTLRNTSSYESWNPDRINLALCDMVRTAGPVTKTKLSFNSPTLERGFHFMSTAIKSEIRFETVMAMVNFREQICVNAGEEEACKSMRIQYWTNDTLAFTQNLERLWLDVRTSQETRVLQQLIELNPRLKKLGVTTGTRMFYKIYEVVQKAVVGSGHSVPMKLTLKDERNTSLSWSELVVPPERKKDQTISLDYSAGATNISTVLMFFGYMITHLTSLEFTDLDVKTLEACTRSRGSNITCLDVNILGLSRKGLEDLGKLVDRSADSMSQPSSRISIHLSVMDGIQPDWPRVTTFVIGMGPKIDELVLYSRQIGESRVETFFDRVTPETLSFLSVLIVRGSVGALPGLSKGSITTLSAAISSAMSVAGLASTPTGSNKTLAPAGPSAAPTPASAAITTPSPSPLATLESELINAANQTTSSQFSSKFLPWLESIVSRLPLQKVGLNYVLLETEEWRSVLSKINHVELQCLDLKGSKMTMPMFYELPSLLPTYDRFLTSVSPIATYEMIKSRKERTRTLRPFEVSEVLSSAPLAVAQHDQSQETTNGGSNGIVAIKTTAAPTTRRKGKPARQQASATTPKERKACAAEEKEAAAKAAAEEAQLSVRRRASKAEMKDKSRKAIVAVQEEPEKRQACPVHQIKLPLTSDFKLERYQKVMIQNAIRAQLIGCEVD